MGEGHSLGVLFYQIIALFSIINSYAGGKF